MWEVDENAVAAKNDVHYINISNDKDKWCSDADNLFT